MQRLSSLQEGWVLQCRYKSNDQLVVVTLGVAERTISCVDTRLAHTYEEVQHTGAWKRPNCRMLVVVISPTNHCKTAYQASEPSNNVLFAT